MQNDRFVGGSVIQYFDKIGKKASDSSITVMAGALEHAPFNNVGRNSTDIQ